MATSPQAISQSAATNSASLLVALPSMPQEALAELSANLELAFDGVSVLAASPDIAPDSIAQEESKSWVRLTGYLPAAHSRLAWTATAADYLNTWELSQLYPVRAILQLGSEANSLAPSALRALAASVLDGGADLAVAHYEVPTRSGLVSSAILYPMTRAVFGTRARFPLAPDLCLSPRMAERLATTAQRFTAQNQPDALIWPVSEAAAASLTITDVEAGTRTFAQPSSSDLNSLLAQVTGSLFSDLEQKASTWQRARVAVRSGSLFPSSDTPTADRSAVAEEVAPMLDSFRLAYGNLREIWSLVLPPQTLLGLKRLAETPYAQFRLPESLWARIVYDFLLAFRLRTINRGHLLGALTPLYLAWVASHILATSAGMGAEQHVELQAEAFEADKPYLVSRWRWPDRFNP